MYLVVIKHLFFQLGQAVSGASDRRSFLVSNVLIECMLIVSRQMNIFISKTKWIKEKCLVTLMAITTHKVYHAIHSLSSKILRTFHKFSS